MCSSEKIIPSNENEEKVQQHENIKKSILRTFPGWNSNNIDQGINDWGDEICLVDGDHPVIVLIKSVLCKQGVLDKKKVESFYQVKKGDVEKCVSVIKRKMKEEECNS